MGKRSPFHGGASPSDVEAEHRADRRWWIFRRMTLVSNGVPFLERWAIDTKRFGIYLHHIVDADPGMDLHDHPWPFVSIVLRGWYRELTEDGRLASRLRTYSRRRWGAGSIHVMPRSIAHQIIDTGPHTWSLIIRGQRNRDWGFYPPEGWVAQQHYDYPTRRPVEEI